MNNPTFRKTISGLSRAAAPNRRLECEITLLALAPEDAQLDSEAGIDGWDIVRPPSEDGETDVWLPAEDILYVTTYVDAAIELCTAAQPTKAPIIIYRALSSVVAFGPIPETGESMAGVIAREIMVELLHACALDRRAAASAQAARRRAAPARAPRQRSANTPTPPRTQRSPTATSTSTPSHMGPVAR